MKNAVLLKFYLLSAQFLGEILKLENSLVVWWTCLFFFFFPLICLCSSSQYSGLQSFLKAFPLKVTGVQATLGKVTASVTKLAKRQYLMMAY